MCSCDAGVRPDLNQGREEARRRAQRRHTEMVETPGLSLKYISLAGTRLQVVVYTVKNELL